MSDATATGVRYDKGRKETEAMKLISRSLALILVLVLMCVAIPKANAVVMVLESGETATFYLDYSNVCAVDGEIVFSDPSIISNVKYDISGSCMNGLVENGRIFLYAEGAEGVSGRIGITITVHSAAPKGSSCTVTFRYAETAPGSDTPGEIQTVKHTVTVRTDDPVVTQPTEPKPTNPVVKYADTTALREQIQIAENLTYYDYTKESWSVVSQAVANGKNLLNSTSQSKVDQATKDLKVALGNLVVMDYSKLQAALDSAADMDKHEALAGLWSDFLTALENARVQRTGGDQAAADAAADELIAAKEALLKGLGELGELVVVEKEVFVEVDPTYPFCNKPGHTVILIIMIVSLALNAALIGVIAWYFYKKHRNKRDDTPLVDYNIEDDMPDIEE
jgi:hypothetical protein